MIKREIASVFTYVPYIYIYMKFDPGPAGTANFEIGCVFATHLKQKKKTGRLVVLILSDYLTRPIATHASI